MSRGKDIWNTKENAEAYNLYASNFPMYIDTSRDLVKISGINLGTTLIDLACGTGTTTQAIMDATNSRVNIIAVDQAEEMLKKVKEKFVDGNVRFISSEAEDLDKVISEPIDAVICNSAFWQMKAQTTIRAVSNVLKSGGIFAFNLPDSFFNYSSFKKQPINPAPYNLNDLIGWAKEVKLTMVTEMVKTYSKTAEEVIAFNEIPVMKRSFKTDDEKNKFFEKLQNDKNKNILGVRQWVYLVFRKK